MTDLHEILARFDIDSSADTVIEPYGNGHINRTYLAHTEPKTVLQYINRNVFPEPEKVMENIAGITAHLEKKLIARGDDPARETLRVVPARDGKSYVEADGSLYRLFYLIDGHSIELATNPEHLYRAAKSFGKFLEMLADYPVETLHETIKNFHNTADRYAKFRAAVEADVAGRAASVASEIAFVTDREADCSLVTNYIASGEIPLRVTHNDTKLNNFLFDKNDECIALIDLDTVMPGSLLYDYGDALRFGSSSAAEDETDLSKVSLDIELFRAYAEGFIRGSAGRLSDEECALLPIGAMMMTFECGMRFLTDYLDGDVYFRTHYPTHNLDRCRNQFALLSDMECKLEQMRAIVEELTK